MMIKCLRVTNFEYNIVQPREFSSTKAISGIKSASCLRRAIILIYVFLIRRVRTYKNKDAALHLINLI